MDVDLSRLPTGGTAWRALIDHALSLGDLSEVGYLELKGLLPFTERTDRKRSAVVLARAVLGMGNRMPDVAAAHLEGFGVVLVGIQDQNLVGAEQVDGAVLRDAVQSYVGEDGPQWDYVFVDHRDGLVLALVVDPPRWGDRTHACRKEYSAADGGLTVRDGEVFVRQPGATKPAASHDIAQLERRRGQAPHQGAEVVLGYDSGFDHLDPDNVPNLIEQAIERRADGLLDGLPAATNPAASLYETAGLSSLLGGARFEDRRAPAVFRREVEEWQVEAREAVPDVAADFLRYHRAQARFQLTNESTKYLEAVRAQIFFPAEVVVLAESDSDYCDHGHEHFDFFQLLPDAPLRWGADNGLGMRNFRTPSLPSHATWRSDSNVEATADEWCVTWDVGDLRPGSTEATEERFAVYSASHVPEVVARWKVTARGVNHVFEGELRIPCGQESGGGIGWSYRPAGE